MDRTHDKPLRGVRVLEVEAIGPVPWACMVLADLGAEVVRIENPASSHKLDTHGAVLRGRTRVELDLKTPAGRTHFLSLAQHADVLIEGMRPQVMERLQLGPEPVFAANAHIVYARMTGWGQQGALAGYAGHDINYIAVSGLLDCIGPKEKPAIPLNLLGDFSGGSCFLLIGILASLLNPRHERNKLVIDAAMVDGASVLMSLIYSRLAMGQWTPERESNPLDGGRPWYDTYQTQDGKRIAIGALEPKFYDNLLQRLGLQGRLPPRDNPNHWAEIRETFARVFATKTRDAWVHHFDGCDACLSPVLSMTETAVSAVLQERGTFAAVQGGHLPAPAPLFSGVRPALAESSTTKEVDSLLAEWQQRSSSKTRKETQQ